MEAELNALLNQLNSRLQSDNRSERFEYCEETGWDETENWHGLKLSNQTEPKNSIYISYDRGSEFTVEYLGTHTHIDGEETSQVVSTVMSVLNDRIITACKYTKAGKWFSSQNCYLDYFDEGKLSRNFAEEKAYLSKLLEKYDLHINCWSGRTDEETKFKVIRDMMGREKSERKIFQRRVLRLSCQRDTNLLTQTVQNIALDQESNGHKNEKPGVKFTDEQRCEFMMYGMQNYLHFFFDKFDYPKEARECLFESNRKIYKNVSTAKKFEGLLNQYGDSMNCDYKGMIDEMKSVSAEAEISEHTGYLLMFIGMSDILRGYYKKRGISSDIWKRCMFDLKYKLAECRAVYGNWGTFVPGWFSGFFNMTRFAFEKLQFEAIRFGKNYENNGVVLTPDSTVLNVHIPRTGERLDRESVDRAYAQAKEFFADKFVGVPTVFSCHSWLLFPRHKEMMKPGSNLLSFISDYDIVESGEYQDYREIWRLFDMNYTPELSKLPSDTSLRRSYIELMQKGEKTGWGHGVYIYG